MAGLIDKRLYNLSNVLALFPRLLVECFPPPWIHLVPISCDVVCDLEHVELTLLERGFASLRNNWCRAVVFHSNRGQW